MERAWLAAQLAAGRSLEAIARECGRHPSTVAYWARRHGLRSERAERYAARGGLSADMLAPLVAEGLSIRQIAARVDRSTATVRHWLRRHELVTHRAAMLADRSLRGPTGWCSRHGDADVAVEADGYARCRICRSEAVTRRRRLVRERLVHEAGGRCAACGYDRSTAALQFHHVDPRTKLFTIRSGSTRSLDDMRAEAAKCLLLCATCHAEVEAGVRQLS